jgi:branched-chain amino acid transport system ATP-binding protein
VRREGDLRFAGASIGALPTFEIARRGIGYVAEQRDLFPALSVEENLRLGVKPGATRAAMRDALARAWARFPMLAQRRATKAGVLSGGEQQMLALARALAGEPRLLIVDEPTEGLSPAAVVQVTRCLAALREAGTAVLLIEQRLVLARALDARVVVLGHGRVVFDGRLDALDAATTERWLVLGG